jgi:predicted 3-demethylubiquinone-9 3-methyltransferase (glyoxalase superfamily)
MQKITPFLWFDNNAEEAIQFYTSIFKDSSVGRSTRYGEAGPGKKGTVMTATFRLAGREFMALNGGAVFKFTPAISLFVECETEQEVDQIWKGLSEGGKVLMELDSYPWSKKYGWVADRFGLSWQVNLAGSTQKISPLLMFVGKQSGKAEEAMKLYASIFNNSRIAMIEKYGKGTPQPEEAVMHARFSLDGEDFMAMDGGLDHQFTFTEATSFFVSCKAQAEVDEFWERLSAGGEKGQCGWLKDRYGVSWQIVPTILGEMLQDKDPDRAKRVTMAMLQMKKLDIVQLKEAYEGGRRNVR